MKPSRFFTLHFIQTLTLNALCVTAPAFAQIDLHAHLDMKPGMKWMIHGAFSEPPQAQDWETRFATRASAQSLMPMHSPPIIVVSLYGHPYFSDFFESDRKANVQRAIEAEYQHLKTFVESNSSHFEFARTSTDAQRIVGAHKTAIVLSIEGGYGTLENEDDLKKWIDERGVAIVTPFHLTEDDLGGSALMNNSIAIFNSPLDFLRSVWITGGRCLTTLCRSTIGIKPNGQILIDALLKRRVWIDLAHANDLEAQSLIPQLEERHLPLLVTHTQFRDFFPAERGIAALVIDYLKRENGIIGLIPTDDMIKKAPHETVGCRSGLAAFKQIVLQATRVLGPEKVTLGSDVNAPLRGLSPLCSSENTDTLSNLEQNGYYTYSQWNLLSEYVAPDVNWTRQALTQFIQQWKRVRP